MAACEDGSHVITATFSFVIESCGLQADRLECFFECMQQKALLVLEGNPPSTQPNYQSLVSVSQKDLGMRLMNEERE